MRFAASDRGRGRRRLDAGAHPASGGARGDKPDYPTFHAGHVANVLWDAVAEPHRTRGWVSA